MTEYRTEEAKNTSGDRVGWHCVKYVDGMRDSNVSPNAWPDESSAREWTMALNAGAKMSETYKSMGDDDKDTVRRMWLMERSALGEMVATTAIDSPLGYAARYIYWDSFSRLAGCGHRVSAEAFWKANGDGRGNV